MKPRLKKGQPKRFRKGNLVRACSSLPPAPADFISTWNHHPVYDRWADSPMWLKNAEVVGLIRSKQIYTVIDTHNFPHPSREQYCLVLGLTGEAGWVSSRFLEKIQ